MSEENQKKSLAPRSLNMELVMTTFRRGIIILRGEMVKTHPSFYN